MQEKEVLENKGIGQILKEEREKKGLTWEEVYKITKLRPKIIEAIEKEAWNELPPSVFVKGFIRSYASTLGLDPESLLKLYEKTEHAQQKYIFTDQKAKKTKKNFFYWASFIVLFLGCVLLVILGIKKYHISVKKQKISDVKNLSNGCSTVLIEKSFYFPVILEARTKKEIWLKIVTNKHEEKKYLLQPGECISWQIKNNFELITEAGSINLWLNNMPINFDKKDGQILYLRLLKKHKGVKKI